MLLKIADAAINVFCIVVIVAAMFVAAGTGIWIAALTLNLIWK